MTGLLKLAERLEAKAGALDEDASALCAKVVETIVTDLVYVTPVDESTALSNWQVSVGSPAQAPIPAYFPGEGGSTQAMSAQEAIAAARRELLKKKPGQSVYISNVLRYIDVLNQGSSSQEPAGFVERAVLLGRKVARNTKLVRRK